jgi:hypothetical protein
VISRKSIRSIAIKAAAAALAVVLLMTAQTAATKVNASTSSQQQVSCSCVLYVRSRVPSLPGGPQFAKDYTQSKMSTFGFKKVNPTAGAILVWDANQKGAGSMGHIALIRSASYDTKTKKWIITVDQANWGTACSITTNSKFTWGDLYGVNAYVRR